MKPEIERRYLTREWAKVERISLHGGKDLTAGLSAYTTRRLNGMSQYHLDVGYNWTLSHPPNRTIRFIICASINEQVISMLPAEVNPGTKLGEWLQQYNRKLTKSKAVAVQLDKG